MRVSTTRCQCCIHWQSADANWSTAAMRVVIDRDGRPGLIHLFSSIVYANLSFVSIDQAHYACARESTVFELGLLPAEVKATQGVGVLSCSTRVSAIGRNILKPQLRWEHHAHSQVMGCELKSIVMWQCSFMTVVTLSVSRLPNPDHQSSSSSLK